MKFYKATDSRGKVHARSTRDRTYTHAIVSHYLYRGWGGEEKWHDGSSFAGSLGLAHARAKGSDEVVEAVEITGAEYRAILKAAKAK